MGWWAADRAPTPRTRTRTSSLLFALVYPQLPPFPLHGPSPLTGWYRCICSRQDCQRGCPFYPRCQARRREAAPPAPDGRAEGQHRQIRKGDEFRLGRRGWVPRPVWGDGERGRGSRGQRWRRRQQWWRRWRRWRRRRWRRRRWMICICHLLPRGGCSVLGETARPTHSLSLTSTAEL